MKLFSLLSTALIAAGAFPQVSGAETWTAGTALAATEKPDDDGDAVNPHPAAPAWSYGYRTDIAGTALTLYTAGEHTDNFVGLNDAFEGFHIMNIYSIPSVLVNTDAAAQMLSFGAGPIEPGQIFMHGGTTEFSVVRFRVPVTGRYAVSASFRPVHGGDIDAHIVVNGESIFDESLPSGSPATEPVFPELTLTVGDSIDFLAGINGSLGGDATAFDATVTSLTTIPIVPSAENIARSDNGTPTNPNDDTVSFTLTVAGEAGSVSAAGWKITSPSALAGVTGPYGTPKSVAGMPIAAFDALTHKGVVTLADAGNPALTDRLTITAPWASLHPVISNVNRQDGPSADPADDTWSYSVTVNGVFTGAGWTSDNPSAGSGSYGVVTNVTGLSVSETPSQTTVFADTVDPSATAAVTVYPPALRVNIDFDALRPGDTASAGTYSGSGAGGGGVFFNSLVVDSTGGDDNLTVSASNLKSDTGAPTPVAFTIGPVGGDHEPGQPLEPARLYDDYIFNNSAANSAPTGSPFTISGLGEAQVADLYFYVNAFNGGTIEIEGAFDGGTPGTYNGLNALAFFGVPVANGSVSGFFARNGATGVLGGLSVVTAPQTSTLISPELGSITRSDNGTPANPNDDTVGFTLTVTGDAEFVSPAGWRFTSPASLAAVTGAYGTPKVVTGVPIAAFSGAAHTLGVTIADAANPAIKNGVTVTAPWGTLQAVVSNVARQSGPTADLGDDTWSFSLTVLGQYTGPGWVSNDETIPAGSYGVAQNVTNLPVRGVSGKTIMFLDSADSALTTSVTVTPPSAPALRLNIDFDGIRPGDTGNAGTYAGGGAAGGGTVFNGIAVDSTGGDDNLMLSATNLLSDAGVPTAVSFAIGPVGGDHEPAQGLAPAALFDDYIFNNSAANSSPSGSPFTISGLGNAVTADLYLYITAGEFSIDGSDEPGNPGVFNGLNARAWYSVPVTNGTVTGVMGGNGLVSVMGGLTIVTGLPSGGPPLPEFTSLTRSGGAVSLTFTTVAGLRYQAQYSDNLTAWFPLGAPQTGAGSPLTVTDPSAPAGRRYYRTVVSD